MISGLLKHKGVPTAEKLKKDQSERDALKSYLMSDPIENQFFPNHGQIIIDSDGNKSATIIDAELDPIQCEFHNDGCIHLNTKELAYVVLTEDNLMQMIRLINKAS